MGEARNRAAYALASLGGGIAGVKLWRAHPVLGFLLGSVLGGHAAALVTGYNPWSEVFAGLAKPEARPLDPYAAGNS